MSDIYQYDKLIEFFGYTGEEWPQMRLFLNMIKDNYYSSDNKSVKFTQKLHPEVDSANYINKNDSNYESSSKDGSISNQFACFLNELLAFISNRELQNLQASDSGKINTPQQRFEAFKLGLTVEWFRELLFELLVVNSRTQLDNLTLVDVGPSVIKFKNRKNIIEALDGKNLFYNLEIMDENSKTGNLAEQRRDYQNRSDEPSQSNENANSYLLSYSTKKLNTGLFSSIGEVCLKFRGEGKPIGFKFDKYVLKNLLNESVKTKLSKSNFFDNSSYVVENKYYRRVGDNKRLYTEIGGKEVAVEIGSQEYMKLVMGNNCYNLGIKSSEPSSKTECANFVMKCLGGKDIQDCKDYMLKNNFWKDVIEEVENMNPDMACDLLRKFAFPTVEETVSEVGLKLKMFVNTTQWLDSLKNREFPGKKLDSKIGFTDEEILKISKNRELIGYLDALVTFVNKNPGILNTNYAKGQLTSNPNAFEGTTLKKYGLSGKIVVPSSGVPSVSSIVALQSTIRQNKIDIATLFGLPSSNIGFNLQRGGGVTGYFEALKNDFTEPLRLSVIFEKHLNSFMNHIRSLNKEFNQADIDETKKLISELKTLEEKLLKAAIYTSKYHDLVSVFGQEDTNGLITLDNLQKFVDKRNSYFQRTNQKQDLISILIEKIAEIIQKK